jgi:hypothetical protein
MKEKDRVIQGKQERQRTMDKLSVKSGRAYTYDPKAGSDSGCAGEKTRSSKQSIEKRAR